LESKARHRDFSIDEKASSEDLTTLPARVVINSNTVHLEQRGSLGRSQHRQRIIERREARINKKEIKI
jgi:hypothetical protein